jgi:hypothetical protein
MMPAGEIFDFVTGELSTVSSQKYRVDVYGEDGLDVLATYTTFGSWCIEGDFIVVWDIDGVRHAFKLDPRTQTIRTLPTGNHEKAEEKEGSILATEYGEEKDVPDQQEV